MLAFDITLLAETLFFAVFSESSDKLVDKESYDELVEIVYGCT